MRSARARPEGDGDAEGDTSSCSHAARKALFTRALRRGWLRLDEIDAALPSGTLSEAERWLLLASLRAADVELRDGTGRAVAIPTAPKALRKGAA
jgi:hypothetical protein